MALFKQQGSPYWYYDFRFNGKRYRESTKQRTKTAAAQVEADALTALARGEQGLVRIHRGCTLREFSARFLEWVERSTELQWASRRYYRYGWRLLNLTPLASRPMNSIKRDEIACVTFQRPSKKDPEVLVPCSNSYSLQALRTLKVMLGKAVDWEILHKRPRVPMPKRVDRNTYIDHHTDASLEKAFHQPIKHRRTQRTRQAAWTVMVCVNDAGMRPDEVFPMEIEHLDFVRRQIWVPEGKTNNARRFVVMSDRMAELLKQQIGDRRKGWVFLSPRSKSGHLTTIAKGFSAARDRGNVDSSIVLYSGRHTYATYMMEQTGNVFAVSKSMGHGSIRSMEPYQHPNRDLGLLSEAINRRNRERDAALSAPESPTTDAAVPHSGLTSGHTTSTIQ